MAREKKPKQANEVLEPTTQAAPPVVEPKQAPQLSEAQLNKVVRVVNKGKPFPCDLMAYGYGMRWPTNAVYSIPTRKFMELLEQGFEGQNI